MSIFSKLRKFAYSLALFVPTFPSLISKDTQLFFIVVLLQHCTFHRASVISFTIIASVFLAESFLIEDYHSFIVDALTFLLFLFLVFFISWEKALVEMLYRNMNAVITTCLILTVFRYLYPEIEFLFSPRGAEVDFNRSIPFVYAEPSYAAKAFFGMFIGFTIALRKMPKRLIALQFLTLSLTGAVTGILSIFIFFMNHTVVGARRYLKYALFFLSLLLILGLLTPSMDSIQSSRFGVFIALVISADLNAIYEFFQADASLQTRIGNYSQVGDINSLFEYIVVFPVTCFIFLVWLVFDNFKKSVVWFDLLLKGLAVLVFGYADSFVNPGFLFVIGATYLDVKARIFSSATRDIKIA